VKFKANSFHNVEGSRLEGKVRLLSIQGVS